MGMVSGTEFYTKLTHLLSESVPVSALVEKDFPGLLLKYLWPNTYLYTGNVMVADTWEDLWTK